MIHPSAWIKVLQQGLYCIPGDFFIDPISPVDQAIITHAHADHARPGHKNVLATAETIDVMKLRYNNEYAIASQTVKYHQILRIKDTTITLIPAGHILGSAQIVIEYGGSRLIVSGDYKRKHDPTCSPFEVKNCDVFVTEATFALPVFKYPELSEEISKLLSSLTLNPNNCHLIGVYALGKCQRLILLLRNAGYQKPIYLHGALYKLCQFYQASGFNLGELLLVSDENKNKLKGEIILCPPSSLNDRWSRKLPDPIKCFASGWMRVRARAKQQKIELPLIISDHADWNELLQTITEVAAPEIWVTHGREEALIYQANKMGFKAKALNLLGYNEEED